MVPKWHFNLEIGGYVDPYNWILKIESGVSYKTKVVCAGREGVWKSSRNS
jgi:hypothetical protein